MALRKALLERGRVRAWVLCLLAFVPARAHAERADDRIARADEAYRDSNYLEVQSILGGMEDIGAFPTPDERVHGYRLLALSRYYLGHVTEAHDAFFALLKQDPYFELTLEPSKTIKFFNSVRDEENAALEPIRQAIEGERRLMEQEARNRAEADTRADEIRRLKGMQLTVPQVVERRIIENSLVIALMPFGLGQFVNGKTNLGAVFAASEGLAVLVSCGSWVGVEDLRVKEGPYAGTFAAKDVALANGLNVTKWVASGIFYALWASGAIEAVINFVPSHGAGAHAITPPPGPTAVEPPRAQPIPAAEIVPPVITSPSEPSSRPPVAAPVLGPPRAPPSQTPSIQSPPTEAVPVPSPSAPLLEQPIPIAPRPSAPHSETLPPPPADSLHGS